MSQFNLEPTKSKRHWFQFSLRSLLLVTLIFGCGLGWVANERRKSAECNAKLDVIDKLGGKLTYFALKEEEYPKWLVMLVGNPCPCKCNSSVEFLYASNLQASSIAILAQFPKLDILRFKKCTISQEGFKAIGELTQISYLSFDETNLSNRDIGFLAKLEQLTLLDVKNSKVTQEGIEELQKALPTCEIRFYGIDN